MYVFLSDDDTFSPINGATLLSEDGKAQFDLQMIFDSLTAEQLNASLIPVKQTSLDALEES